MASIGETQAPVLLALTQGDPSGVGPDITLAAWLRRGASRVPFAVAGDPAFYARRAKQLGLAVPVRETDWAGAPIVFDAALPVVPVAHGVIGTPGQPSTEDAAAIVASIEVSVESVARNLSSAVVTNPVAKHVLYQAGFQHPGHTEFLGVLAQAMWQTSATPVMMLWSETLSVVPITIHVPLSAVPKLLSIEKIVERCRIVHTAMRDLFGVPSPRLAVAGLNPHAGENGSMGREEIEIIGPALDRLRAEGLTIEGPLSADTMFHPQARARYDVAVTMYHDQGLIPIKTLSFDTGVNVTLGLPFVRTSPDHGTAFGIAGQGTANPSSLLGALQLAARLARGPRRPT